MREEYLLDALTDYQIEPDDPTRTVPNPARRAQDKKIRAAKAEVTKLEQEYGAAAMDNPETDRPTMRGFKIAHGKIGKQLRAARERLEALYSERRGLPARVEVRETSDEAIIKLAFERKHLTSIIKMVAYQAESDLLAQICQEVWTPGLEATAFAAVWPETGAVRRFLRRRRRAIERRVARPSKAAMLTGSVTDR
jgi:hypothetical protein